MRSGLVALRLRSVIGVAGLARNPLPRCGLSPHRAVYDLSLARSNGVAQRRHRARPHRLRFRRRCLRRLYAEIPPGDGPRQRRDRLADARRAHRDLRGGRRQDDPLQDRARSWRGAKDDRVDGDAELQADGALVDSPEAARSAKTCTCSGEPVFPTEHMKRLIEAGPPGPDDPRRSSSMTARTTARRSTTRLRVIGRRIEPGAGNRSEEPARQDGLAKLAALADDDQLFHRRAAATRRPPTRSRSSSTRTASAGP